MAFTLSRNALHSAVSRIMSCVVAISTVASMSFAYADVELNGQNEALSSQEQVNVVLNGKFTQGALLRGQAPAGAKVTLNGETVQTNKDGKFLLALNGKRHCSKRWL